ncbi:MAG: hypothetical protein PUD07_02720 [bacterium]|nr:hypothetical protein [bacterium]
MNNGINNYLERIKNPNLPLIDFEFLMNHPEFISYVWEKYVTDMTFKNMVNEKIMLDVNFKYKFLNTFKSFIDKGKSR